MRAVPLLFHEAAPVVPHLKKNVRASAGQVQVNAGGACMFRHIGESFLHNAVNGQFDLRRQRMHQFGEREIDSHACPLRKLRAECAHGRD